MSHKTKLELTRIGKNNELHIEPRILIESPDLSYGDPDSENILIHGDNLLALKALEQDYAGKVKCIYIDPPFNTGAAFEYYDDAIEHSIRLSLMRRRLQIMRNLLTEDGAIFVNLDDSESAYCKVLLDEIFGRQNYFNEIIVATNKAFGFKSTSDGIFKQANHLFFYAKDKIKFNLKINSLFIEKEYDAQYKWVFSNIDKDYKDWTRKNIKEVVAEKLGYESSKIAQKEIKEQFNEQIALFAIENADNVFRTASVSGGALIKRKETILKSKENKNIIFKHPNDDMDYMFIGGERVIFYKERIKNIDGILLPGELVTDIWNDISIEGLSSEGGIDFPKGKKPEKLIQRCIDIISNPGDLVLDSFLGSGTTSAVAHKMGRKWIGIEMGNHAYTHCKARIDKVIDGEQGGISKLVDWKGGGGYKFYELGPSLLIKDDHGNYVINPALDGNKLIQALCKIENFHYTFSEEGIKHGRSSEKDFLHVTTRHVNQAIIDEIREKYVGKDEGLLILAKTFDDGLALPTNIQIKKIPKSVMRKCEYGKDDYNLPITENEIEDKEDSE